MTLAEARKLLPADMKSMTDAELSGLLANLYSFADLVLDIHFERKGGNG